MAPDTHRKQEGCANNKLVGILAPLETHSLGVPRRRAAGNGAVARQSSALSSALRRRTTRSTVHRRRRRLCPVLGLAGYAKRISVQPCAGVPVNSHVRWKNNE